LGGGIGGGVAGDGFVGGLAKTKGGKTNNYTVLGGLNPDTMAKGMNSKKADKKEPAKTAKEKKLEKKDKKPGYQ
jgi:hypothetical protein